MTIALLAKKKYAFVDGSLPRNLDNDSLYVPWIHCNTMVLQSWFINSLSKENASSVNIDLAEAMKRSQREIFTSKWTLRHSIEKRYFMINSTK